MTAAATEKIVSLTLHVDRACPADHQMDHIPTREEGATR